MRSVRFACQPGCTNCCDQEGIVYLTEADIMNAAAFIGMTTDAFEKKYVCRTRTEARFRKPRKKQCPFLTEAGCGIHPAKPTQCRTFPYWPEFLDNSTSWNRLKKFCPGIGKGPLIQINTAKKWAEEQRDAFPGMYE